MSNLKRDLVEELIRDKKYLEMELAGLAQNTLISYRKKVEKMKNILNEIAVINGSFSFIEVYFPEPVPQPDGSNIPEPEQSVQAPVQEQEIVNEPIIEEPMIEELTVEAPVKEESKTASTSPFPKIN